VEAKEKEAEKAIKEAKKMRAEALDKRERPGSSDPNDPAALEAR
jgi:hypothetical protein